jgi:3-carboxy-cis,cis-muconate cycloisomerase
MDESPNGIVVNPYLVGRPVLNTGMAARLFALRHASAFGIETLHPRCRPAGAWHAEWQSLREALRLTGGAAFTAVELAEGLEVDTHRMRANVDLTRGAIVAERLAVALTPVLGGARSKSLFAKASFAAAAEGRMLGTVLRELPELVDVGLDDLPDPARHTGAAGPLVDRVLLRYRSCTGS